MKFFLAALGCLSFVLGVVGIFVPLLPTTPFLLLSAALWVRSSPRLYDWLLAHPCLGGYVRNFRENRAIPLRAKIVSLTLMYGQTNEKYKEDSRKSSTAYRKPITYSRASNFGSKNEM